jgi:hypothetical protein
MLNFKQLTLNEIPIIRPVIQKIASRTCDSTVGGIFMWRDFCSTRYALEDNQLFLQVSYQSGFTAYTYPLGENIPAALRKIEKHCKAADERMVLCGILNSDLPLLSSMFNCAVSSERDWFDYLYDAEDLRTLAGRRYSGQRNHINAFMRDNPSFGFEVITPENLPDVKRFYERFTTMEQKESAVFKEDRRKVSEILENYDAYGLLGGAIRADGEIIAFALGETVGDTLFVHVEKADFTRRGTYQMIVREFAKHFAGEDIKYINREDDAGDLGLRTSKLSYHPCRLIEKYTVMTDS